MKYPVSTRSTTEVQLPINTDFELNKIITFNPMILIL